MRNLSLFSNKNDDDRWNTSIALFLITIFFIGKAIVTSGHLLLFIVCTILGIVLYYSIGFIQKKNEAKPASLGIYSKKYPIIVQYNPPKGINPAEAGLLYNCSVEPTDLTSLIYRWKFENFVDIKTSTGKNSKREYIKLVKKNDLPLTRPLFESEIFDSIFSTGNVKIMEGAFHLRYALMLEDLEYHGIQKGWLVNKEEIIKRKKIINISKNQFGEYRKRKFGGKTLLIGIYFLIVFIIVLLEELSISTKIFNNFSISEFARSIILILLIGTLIILLYGKIDGRSNLEFTEKGAELASKVIGYSQFIKSCDENKIKLLLKEDPLFIDRTLPYATAFGMETKFLNKISPSKKELKG